MVIDMNYWRKVLKNIVILLISILALFLGLKLAIFYMPFLIAFIISLFLEPIIKFIMKKMKLKRKTSSIIVFLLAITIIIGILSWSIASLTSEISDILLNFNEYADMAYDSVQALIRRIDFNKIQIPQTVMDTLQNSAIDFLGVATNWTKTALTGIIKFITSIPVIGIYVVVTLLSLYFICVDKIYMVDQLEHHLPETWVKKIGVHLKSLTNSLGGYLKAQIILIIISFIISLIGLYAFHFFGWNIEYPLIMALFIGFVDALPIFGSGTVMLPWAIFTAFMGDVRLAIGIFTLWMIMSIIKQIIEPKIVSGKIGIHPIFTLIAMYTGFKFIGIIGMFIGPIILIILKNIYGTLIDRGVVKTILER